MEQKTECTKCKNKPLNKTVLPMVLLGFYILATSIYGTYVLLQNIFNFFR